MFRGLRRGFLDLNFGYRTRGDGARQLNTVRARFTRPPAGVRFDNTNRDRLHRLHNRLRGQQLVVTVRDRDGSVLYEREVFAPSRYRSFVEEVFFDYPEGWLPEINDYGVITIRIARDLERGFLLQEFREGITNCVLRPINNWADNLHSFTDKRAIKNKLKKLEKEFKNGVPQRRLGEVARKLNVNINILAPFSKKVLFKGVTDKKKPRYTFNLDNTYENHVDEDGEVFYISQDEMNDMDLEPRDMYFDAPTKDKKRIIHTLKRGGDTYIVTNEEQDFYKQFRGCGFCYTKNKQRQEFISNSIHYTGAINFHEEAPQLIQARLCKHIDQKKAYASYRKCPFYEGFLFRTSIFARTDKIQGLGIYLITDLQLSPQIKLLNDKLGFLENENTYPSPFLKWLSSKGVTYRVTAGIWGVRKHFDFPKGMIEDGSYSIFAGVQDSIKPERIANIHGVSKEWLATVEDKVRDYGDGVLRILIPKDNTIYKGHITSFLVGYSYITTLEQLLQFKNLDCVLRVIGDGIYFTGETPPLIGSFREKNEFKHKGGEAEGYFSRLSRCKGETTLRAIPDGRTHYGFQNYRYEPDFLDLRKITVNIENLNHDLKSPCLFAGGGGFGKTYFAANAEWLNEAIFSFPTLDLEAAFLEEYPDKRTMTHARLLRDDKDKKTGDYKWEICLRDRANLVIDEGSMRNRDELKIMIKKAKSLGIFVIVMADLTYQLPPDEGMEASPEDFASVVNFTKDYRSSNRETARKKANVREMMDNNYSVEHILKELELRYGSSVKPEIKERYLELLREKKGKFERYKILNEVKVKYGDTKEYTRDDIIICSEHKFCNEYTEKFASIPKYRIKESCKKYHTGQIFFEEPESGEYELRHGYTIHSVQGKTTRNRLYIDVRRMKSTRMFYTAISRCKDWKSIVFLKSCL